MMVWIGPGSLLPGVSLVVGWCYGCPGGADSDEERVWLMVVTCAVSWNTVLI